MFILLLFIIYFSIYKNYSFVVLTISFVKSYIKTHTNTHTWCILKVMKYIFLPYLNKSSHVRTCWITREGLSPSQCTKGLFQELVVSESLIWCTPVLRSCLGHTMKNTFEQRWAINSAHNLTKKNLPNLTSFLSKLTGSLLYRMC